MTDERTPSFPEGHGGSLEALAALTRRCNRCGFCQEVCPTYRLSRRETDVARGRVQLIGLVASGRFDWTTHGDIAGAVNACLLCRACVVNCPSSVATDDILMTARSELLRVKGFSLFHKLVYRGLLPRQGRLEQVSRLLGALEASGVSAVLEARVARMAAGRLRHWVAHLPMPEAPPARRRLQPFNPAEGTERCRVGYFLGCATNAFWAPAAEAGVRVLQRLGCGVSVLAGGCCGGPHRSAGDMETARRLARRHLEAFHRAPYDWIVSDCATCTHTLREVGRLFDPSDPIQETVDDTVGRILDVVELIQDHLPPLPGLRSLPVRVTYHDPCHAVRGLSIREAPRNLLSGIPDLKFVEMADADACCGGAGAYGFLHPDMSEAILEAKIASAAATGADIVATGCPSCALQLSGGLKAAGSGAVVRHPVDLLAASAGIDVRP